MSETLKEKFEQAGKDWLNGADITGWNYGDKKIEFSQKQLDFLNCRDKRYQLMSGGYGSGKTLVLLCKLLLLSWFFPKNEILLGRKTLMDLEKSTLPQLFDLIPKGWAEYKVKQGIIEFPFNGSRIIFFGLDQMQSGTQADIKKAQQQIKSLNLGAFFIDQLEEVEYDVFESLSARLRKTEVPVRMNCATTNPANFWAYHFFKLNKEKRDDIFLTEISMLENKAHLPEDYLKDQLSREQSYIDRYVLGKWDASILLKNVVFAKEHIQRLEKLVRPPITEEEGFQIWKQPNQLFDKVYIGVDSSEGSVDPSSISVVSSAGELVASWNGKIPVPVLVEKLNFIYSKYFVGNLCPLIILETNSAGMAVLEATKDLNHYRRKVWDIQNKFESEKLGWKTSWASKQVLISHFIELLRQGDFVRIYDKDTIEEFKTFIWSDSARQSGAGAERSFSDDRVISAMLGFLEVKVGLGRRETALEQKLKEMRMRERRRNRGSQFSDI
jgi:hypothetical protein